MASTFSIRMSGTTANASWATATSLAAEETWTASEPEAGATGVDTGVLDVFGPDTLWVLPTPPDLPLTRMFTSTRFYRHFAKNLQLPGSSFFESILPRRTQLAFKRSARPQPCPVDVARSTTARSIRYS